MNQFIKKLRSVGIFLNENQIKDFQSYYSLLLEWNQRTNLFSKGDQSRIIDRHFLESLAVLPSFQLKFNLKIIDIGSGAGFPSLPIRIFRDDLNFTLVESKRLKALFLQEVISELKLDRVSVVCERCEKFAENEKYHHYFDAAFSRAVGSLENMFGWIKHLLKPDGYFIAWKGGDIQKEIDRLIRKFDNLKVEIVNMDNRLIPRNQGRLFVIIKRTF